MAMKPILKKPDSAQTAIDLGQMTANVISQVTEPAKKSNAGRKPTTEEKRTKHLHMVMKQSLYDWVEKQAKTDGRSVADYIHRLLESVREKGK